MPELDFIIITCSALLLAGVVKGILGLGLPITAIGLMTLLLDTRTSIILVIVPIVLLNAWQVYREGRVVETMHRYRWVAGILFAGIWGTAYWAGGAPDRVITGALGISLLAFVATNLFREIPPIPDRLDKPAQIGTGIVAFLLGGLTAIWSPPLVAYLIARRVDKAEFIRASGFIILAGAIPLLIGNLQSGALDQFYLVYSLILMVPGLIGFSIGERIRGHINDVLFRKLILGAFAILGIKHLIVALFFS